MRTHRLKISKGDAAGREHNRKRPHRPQGIQISTASAINEDLARATVRPGLTSANTAAQAGSRRTIPRAGVIFGLRKCAATTRSCARGRHCRRRCYERGNNRQSNRGCQCRFFNCLSPRQAVEFNFQLVSFGEKASLF